MIMLPQKLIFKDDKKKTEAHIKPPSKFTDSTPVQPIKSPRVVK